MTAGLITLPFAYANYQKKKAAYDAALERYESLKDVSDKYQEVLEIMQDRMVGADENGNYAQYDNAPGLVVTPTLQVGMLVGKKMNCRVKVVIENKSKDKSWNISPKSLLVSFSLLGAKFGYVAGLCSTEGLELILVDNQYVSRKGDVYRVKMYLWRNGVETNNASGKGNHYVLNPGARLEMVTYGFPQEAVILSKDQIKLLRSAICDFSGKKLITSVKSGTTIEGSKTYDGVQLLSFDAEMTRTFYVDNDPDRPERHTKWMVVDKVATLEYMGEAFYPATDYFGDMIADTLSRKK